jgi:hypothetical protein
MMKLEFAGCWIALIAGAGCADNGRDVGYLRPSNAGGHDVASGSGGSAGKGGSSAGGGGGTVMGYGGSGGAAGSGAAAGSFGKAGAGGQPQASGGSGSEMPDASHPAGGSGGVSSDRDSGTEAGGASMCGSIYCMSTTCVGLGCGLARCCKTDAGPVCVHGATPCPGEPAQSTLQCRAGSPSAGVTATFDKTCTKDTDCIVVMHWNGCCSASDIAFKAAEQQSFDAFEQTCGGPPPCGCAFDRVYAEDGYPVVAPATAHAACFQGACMAIGQPPP